MVSQALALARRPHVVVAVYMVSQALALARRPHVVVATPGRLADHLRSSSTFSLSKVQFLVSPRSSPGGPGGDSPGFPPSLGRDSWQSLAVPGSGAGLGVLWVIPAQDCCACPCRVRTVQGLEQRYLLVPEALKDAYLVHLVQSFQDQHDDWAIIIFTKTCKDCQVLNMMLRKFSFPSVALHSMMKQKQRFAALAKFKSSIFKILIATDVAARGLDIPAVQVVINHNTPGLPKIYIHRVGRTARAGRKGMAITLVTQYDIHLVHAIEEEIKLQLPEFSVEEQLVLDILTQVNVTRRECEIELEGMDFDEKKEINKRKQMILEGKDPEQEARRKAELSRLRSRNREGRQKLQQSLHRRRQLQLRRKLHRRMERRKRKMEKEKEEQEEQ
ncbi:probable ATP-dependent RNA helicase DDX49 [Geospiza fortis]|uniref:RNA helicase n=1 Tax=Geospiza fortis TaxID=48883 RepID=A0A8N5F2T5_GEOFO|nr:probable ATP-dependent RNA helicase DDX49 [Geospiza fortis]